MTRELGSVSVLATGYVCQRQLRISTQQSASCVRQPDTDTDTNRDTFQLQHLAHSKNLEVQFLAQNQPAYFEIA